MKKWIRSIVMTTAVATGIGGLAYVAPEVNAQAKATPTAKAEPKADPKTPKATTTADVKGKVVYDKDKQGKYRFKIVNEEGKAIAMCTVGYEKLEDCLKAIETVKALLNSKKPEEDK